MEKRKSELLSDSLCRSTSSVVVGEHVQPASSSINHNSTVICYGDISIDYSQYYKEGPITFEDLLSEDEGSVSSSSYSDEGDSISGAVGIHTIIQQSNACSHEEGSGLR